jgi:coproporphyrinogen III oxidase
MSSDWLEDLKPLGQMAQSFLETPYLIIVLDASMNLTQKEKEKQLLRSGKCEAATGFY